MEEMKHTAVRISVPVSVGHQENCCLLTDQMKPLVSRKQRMKKKRKTVLMKTEVRVQVERGGARRSFRGVLHRSACRPLPAGVRGHLVEGGCSLGAFVSGLLLASLYGVSCLPRQELWLCVSLTLSLAAIASFSMGLSSGVRTCVCVMLPSLSAGRAAGRSGCRSVGLRVGRGCRSGGAAGRAAGRAGLRVGLQVGLQVGRAAGRSGCGSGGAAGRAGLRVGLQVGRGCGSGCRSGCRSGGAAGRAGLRVGRGCGSGCRSGSDSASPCVSAQGRKFLLFLFMSALLSGPLTNTLENTERAAAGLLCGAELAANQTQELLQRAATPLF
ncbi:hypothetical protein KUCAC02_037914, partial [Chaenocephalus aceratus]